MESFIRLTKSQSSIENQISTLIYPKTNRLSIQSSSWGSLALKEGSEEDPICIRCPHTGRADCILWSGTEGSPENGYILWDWGHPLLETVSHKIGKGSGIRLEIVEGVLEGLGLLSQSKENLTKLHLILSKGYDELLEIDPRIELLSRRYPNLMILCYPTDLAVTNYNQLVQKEKSVLAFLHMTS